MQDESGARAGVLVGWQAKDLGERLALTLQTYDRPTWQEGEPPQQTAVLMTKSQAAVLANYLLRESGAPPARRPRGWLASLFG